MIRAISRLFRALFSTAAPRKLVESPSRTGGRRIVRKLIIGTLFLAILAGLGVWGYARFFHSEQPPPDTVFEPPPPDKKLSSQEEFDKLARELNLKLE